MLAEQAGPALFEHPAPFGTKIGPRIEGMMLFVVLDADHGFSRITVKKYSTTCIIEKRKKQGEIVYFVKYFSQRNDFDF